MKFSYNWLRELVPALEADAKQLTGLITMKTAECEGYEAVGVALANATPARVLETEAIPDSHNVKALVEADPYGKRTVVCGAPNCRPGITTMYLPLAKMAIAGIESDGMLASGEELGINRDNAGIVELTGSLDPRLAPDTVIEVDNKSLTHRPDLWGHYGLAREVAAITGASLHEPVRLSLLPEGDSRVAIEIEDPALCPRYSALAFENVTVRPSPLWLQYRLEAIGLNSINNIVDVTNFVMAELGQPMHAFDADKLRGAITARPARAGERLTALNGQDYEPTPAALVIADAGGPVAIAGIIGGTDSAIGPETRRIVLESANFQAASIRKTSVRLKLRTDASMRFEKGQDPVNTTRALARAIELLEEVSPGLRVAGGVADLNYDHREYAPIELGVDWVGAKLGRHVTEDEITRILGALGFAVGCDVPGLLSVTVPSWRATKDVSIKDDLLEEVGRMIGYGSIPPQAPLIASASPPDSHERLFLRQLRNQAAAQGYTEIHGYSFVSEAAARQFGFDPESHVRLLNPIASDQDLLRNNLLPGLWKSLSLNAKHFPVFRLFEIGREIHRASDVPREVPHFAASVYRREGDGEANLFELKRLADCLMPGMQTDAAAARAFEHPERAAHVRWQGQAVGRLFEIHPGLGLDGRAAVLDLDLSLVGPLNETRARDKRYRPSRRFPTTAFDLSIFAGLREPVASLQARIAAAAGGEVVEIAYVRQYIGPPVPEGRKSVSFRITLGAGDHTLLSEEAGAIRAGIINELQAAGYELRL